MKKRYSSAILATMLIFLCAIFACVVAATWIIESPAVTYMPNRETYPVKYGFKYDAEQGEFPLPTNENEKNIYFTSQSNLQDAKSEETDIQLTYAFIQQDLDGNRPTRLGYNLTGWKYNNEIIDGTNTSINSLAIPYNADTTYYFDLTADWTAILYSVQYVAAVGDTFVTDLPKDDSEYTIDGVTKDGKTTDKTITIPGTSPKRTGYNFTGWELGGNIYRSGKLDVREIADKASGTGLDTFVFTATWEKIKYSVVYKDDAKLVETLAKVSQELQEEDDVTAMPEDTNKYEIDNTIAITADKPERSGYIFKGWALDNGPDTDYTKYDESKLITSISLNKEFIDNNLGSNTEITLIAVWEEISYTVKFNTEIDQHSLIRTYANSLLDKTEITRRNAQENKFYTADDVAPRTGYLFGNWKIANQTDTDVATYSYLTIDLINNGADDNYIIDLAIVWNAIQYNVEFKDPKHSQDTQSRAHTVSLEGPIKSVIFSPLMQTGYTFNGWLLGENGELMAGSNKDINIPFDEAFINKAQAAGAITESDGKYTITFTSSWNTNKYNIVFVSNPVGAVLPDNTEMTIESAPLAFVEPTLEGYKFEGWTIKHINNEIANAITEAEGKYSFTLTSNIIETYGLADGDTLTFIADFSIIMHTATFELGDHYAEGTIVPSPQYSSIKNYNITLPDLSSNAAVGYEFLGWTINGEGHYTGIYELKTDTKFVASWQAIEYRVVYSVGEAKEDEVSSMPSDEKLYTIEDRNKITISNQAPVRMGYTFDGWSFGGEIYMSGQEINLSTTNLAGITNKTITIVAQWHATEYTINYEFGGGAAKEGNYSKVFTIVSTGIVLPELIYVGYNFDGWYYNQEFTEAVGNNVSGRDLFGKLPANSNAVTLYAKWEVKNLTITYVDNNVEVYTDTVAYNETYEIAYAIDDDDTKIFLGWLIKGDATNKVYKLGDKIEDVTTDITLIAKWDNKIKVSFIAYGLVVQEFYLNKGEKLPDLPYIDLQEDYELVGWFDQEEGGMQYTLETPIPDVAELKLYAHWKLREFTITYYIGDTIVGYTTTYTSEDEEVALFVPIPSGEYSFGYEFNGWYLGKTLDGAKYSGTMSGVELFNVLHGSNTLYGTWIKVEYNVRYGAGDLDGVTNLPSDSKTYKIGGSIDILAQEPKRTGYTFNGWMVAGDNRTFRYNTSNSSVIITEDIIKALNGGKVIVLVAQWTAIEYKVTYELDGGTIDNSSTYLDSNTYTIDGSKGLATITFPTAPKKDGYRFSGWTIFYGNNKYNYRDETSVAIHEVAGYANTKNIIEFTAEWELENQYSVIFDYNNGSNKSETRTINVNGTVMDWPSDPVWEGHYFVGWFDAKVGGEQKTKSDTFSTESDTTLYAHWKLIVYLDHTVEVNYSEMTLVGYTVKSSYNVVESSTNNVNKAADYNIPVDWIRFKTLVSNAVKFVDINGNTVSLKLGTDFNFAISAMNDGTYGYGDKTVSGLTFWVTASAPGASDINYDPWIKMFGNSKPIANRYYAVVGSTYQATVSLDWYESDDYVLYFNGNEYDNAIMGMTPNDSFIVKYKTTQIANSISYSNSTTIDVDGCKVITYGGNWYTVEDSLLKAGSSTIVVAGRTYELPYKYLNSSNAQADAIASFASGYARTAFSALTPSVTKYTNATLDSSRMINYTLSTKLRIPFKSEKNNDYDGNGGETSSVNSVSVVHSTLIIPGNIKLNVSGTFMVGALISSTGTVTNRGVVMNEGIIDVQSGGNIGAYGYIKSENGNGKIIFNSGSKGIDVLKMYDWIGGANTLGISNTHKIFPINAYSVHNISCESIFYAGSAYEAYWTVNMSVVGYKNADNSGGNFKMIGKKDASNTLFRLEKGYIVKTANGGLDATMTTTASENKSRKDNLTSLSGSNQTAGQFDVFKLYGKVTDAEVSITIYNVSLETKTTLALPIGYMDIVVGNDGEGNAGDLTLSAASYRFMPGSSLTVDDGASLTVGSNATIYFYTFDDCDADQNYECYPSSDRNDGYYSFTQKYCKNKVDAEFIVNGTVTINGSLGGKVSTEGSTGILIINGTVSGTIDRISYLKYARLGSTVRTTTRTTEATGNIMLAAGGSEVQPFLKGITYIAIDGVWGRMASYTIKYDANGGTLTGAASETYFDLLGKTVNINSIDTTNPLREHYEFRGWYFDKAFTQFVEDGYSFIVGTVSEITVYAKWEAIEYSINYRTVFDEGTGESGDYSSLPQSFTMDDGSVSFDEMLLGSIDGYVFVGFFTDASCEPAFEISEISVAELIKLLREGSVTIYAFWRDASSKEFAINYVNEEEVEGIGNKFNTHTDTVLQSNNNYQLWMPTGLTVASIYDDKSVSHDFIGWYLIYNGEEKIVKTLADIVELFKDSNETNINVTLYAKWQAKIKVIFRDDVRNFYSATYHHAGEIINVTPIALGYNNTGDTDTNESTYFAGWSIQGDAVNVFTETYNVPESDIGAEITLTAYRADKVQVKFEAVAEFKGYSGWHMAGDVIDNAKIGFNLAYTTDPDNNTIMYYFKGWQKDGDYYLNGYTVLNSDSGTVILIAALEQRTLLNVNISSSGGTATATLTYTKSSGATGTINSNGNYYLPEGTVVNYIIKAQSGGLGGSASWSITINGTRYKNGNSSSSNQTGTFTMPAPGGTGVIVEVTASCLVEGTLITLADGTQKKVEDLQVGDMLLVFNHETGNYESAPLLFNLHANNPTGLNRIINLKFSDGTILRIVGRHGLFDLTLNKYVFIDELSMQDYIGHKFATTTQVDGAFVNGELELISVYITEEYVRYYSPISVMHMNVVAEGLLTVTMLNGLDEGLFNAFEYGEGMKYDEIKMQADIEEYGLYTYEDFKDLIPEELFNALPWKYLKVAVGKGYITWEDILWNINYLFDNEFVT